MLKHCVYLILICSLLTGCAALPTPQTSRGVNVTAIVDATKCELASVMLVPERANEMKGWSAKVALDLKVLYDNSGGPSGTLVVPYSAGTVEASAGLSATALSNRAGHLAYVVKLEDLIALPYGFCSDRMTGFPFAVNELGLGDWLKVAVESVSRKDDLVSLNELTYLLEFIVEQSVTGDVRIRPTVGPTTGSAGIGGRASAKDSNTLLVSLVPPAPKPGTTVVKVVGWPPATPAPVKKVEQKQSGQLSGSTEVPASGERTVVEKQLKKRALRRPQQSVDPYTQQRLDDLQVKQRLFNSITVPRSTLNGF